jgi:hypothetical protein
MQPPCAYASPSPWPEHAIAAGAPLRGAARWLADAGVPRRWWLLACLQVLRWVQPPVDDDGAALLPADTYTLF